MFDAVLSKQQREQRYGAGVVIALLTYAAAIGAGSLFLRSPEGPKLTQPDVTVTLYTALEPAPPPPPPPGPATTNPEPARPQRPKQVRPLEPKLEPKPVEPSPLDKSPLENVEPEPTPEPAADAPASDPAPEPPSGGGGVIGGVAGGVVGGTVGGTLGGRGTGTTVLPFGPGMTRPQQISGAPPTYTREARAARVEGKVLVRCVITATGEVKDCQVIKGVPMLTELVLASLRTSRFTPVHYQGSPRAIQYLFTFNFKLD